jgi:hypothetical protein
MGHNSEFIDSNFEYKKFPSLSEEDEGANHFRIVSIPHPSQRKRRGTKGHFKYLGPGFLIPS